MHIPVIICMLSVVWAKVSVNELCPGGCNCTYLDTQVSVFCRGKSFVNITKKVPSQTTLYHYEALEMDVDLGGANFSHLTSLESLWLSCPYDKHVLHRTVREIPLSQQRVFWPLQNLTELKININWKLNVSLSELFAKFDNLKTLDLSNTRMLTYKNLIRTLRGFPKSTSLRVLNIHNTQTFEHVYNGILLNISELLEPLDGHQLKELDISYNVLRTVVPGLIRFAPNLTTLKVNNNMLIPIFTSAFFTEVMLHPTLVEADFSEQGLGEPIKSTSSDNAADTFINMRALVQLRQSNTRTHFVENQPYQSPQLFPLIDECISRHNTCKIFEEKCKPLFDKLTNNHTMFCLIFDRIIPYSNAIPCDNIPPITAMLRKDCGGCFVFPLVGNLQTIHMQRINNYDEVLPLPFFTNKTCINRNNSLKFFDFSHNHNHGYADIGLALSTPIVGFDTLKVMNFSGNKIQFPSSDLGDNLPQVEVFDFSLNLIDLAGTHGDFLAGASTMKELNLAGNIIQDIPYTWFEDLYNLHILNLSGNSLQTFNVDISNLSNLCHIDLSYNIISNFSVGMTHQLNSQAVKLGNETLRIDLSHNLLLCTCDVANFVWWVHSVHSKHQIEFVNFHQYRCLDESSDQVPLHKINPNKMKKNCRTKKFLYEIGFGAGVVIGIFVTIIIVVCIRNRYRILYHYYIVRNKIRKMCNRRKQQAKQKFRYDVFVSHSGKDKDWVDKVLQPKLENENKIRLCLPARDFELGRPIIESIIESIDKSRKTLLIISPNFIKENMRKFEMRLALQKLEFKGNVLVVAMLQRVENKKMKIVRRALFEEKIKLKWSEDSKKQVLFWEQLIDALDVPEREEVREATELTPVLDHDISEESSESEDCQCCCSCCCCHSSDDGNDDNNSEEEQTCSSVQDV